MSRPRKESVSSDASHDPPPLLGSVRRQSSRFDRFDSRYGFYHSHDGANTTITTNYPFDKDELVRNLHNNYVLCKL